MASAGGGFDPDACPLLKDLAPAERARRIASMPRMRACLSGDGTVPVRTSAKTDVCPAPCMAADVA